MRKGLLVLGIAIGFCVVGAMNDGAEARPQYMKQFPKTYMKLAAKAKVAKCGVCHPGRNKKMRNPYGIAVAKNLGGKSIKGADKIGAAFKKAETEKGTGGKTFGDQIKAGDLPK